MTLRAGNNLIGVITAFASSTETRINLGHNGDAMLFPIGVFNTTLYKNEGWFAGGGTWEEWVTVTTPSTTPPSGHALTFIQYFPLQV